MSTYTATVIKTGNSYALRVPIQYVNDHSLELGQKVKVNDPMLAPGSQDPESIRQAIKKLQEINAYSDIKNPVAWQREIRKDRPVLGREN